MAGTSPHNRLSEIADSNQRNKLPHSQRISLTILSPRAWCARK
jgi:hypothetical protein